MYILRIDHRRYASDPTDRTRTPFTLASAMRAAHGCRNAHIERVDGEDFVTVVADAGRAYSDHVHAPTGRKLRTGSRRYPAPHVCTPTYREGPFHGEVRYWCPEGHPVGGWVRAEATR